MLRPQHRPLQVFLCHASQDKPTVRELYKRLDSEGWIDAWLDAEKLYPGADWSYEIEQAVEAADIILVCISRNSITKEGYIQKELRFVLDQAEFKPEGTLFIIPVRLEECEPPRRLRVWQYVDYFPKDQRDYAYKRLLVSLQKRAEVLGITTHYTEVHAEVKSDPNLIEENKGNSPQQDRNATPNAWVIELIKQAKVLILWKELNDKFKLSKPVRITLGAILGGLMIFLLSRILPLAGSPAFPLTPVAETKESSTLANISQYPTSAVQGTVPPTGSLIVQASQQVATAELSSNSSPSLSPEPAPTLMIPASPLATYSLEIGQTSSTALSPNRKILAVGSEEGVAKLWDLTTGIVLRKLSGHIAAITSLAFSPDGETLVSGSSDGTMKLWDVSSGQLLRTHIFHPTEVYSVFVTFSPDGKYLISVYYASGVKIWDAASGQLLRTLPIFSGGYGDESVIFRSDGKELVTSGYDSVKLWNVETGEAIYTFAEDIGNPASAYLSPDGTVLMIQMAPGLNGPDLMVWDVVAKQKIPIPNYENGTMSPDGKMIALWGNYDFAQLFDIASRQLVTMPVTNMGFEPFTGKFLAFSPDSKELITMENDTVLIWDVATGYLLGKISEGKSYVEYRVFFSPDGKSLELIDRDGIVSLWRMPVLRK